MDDPEIIVKIDREGVWVTQKPKGVILTIRDQRIQDEQDRVIHYGMGCGISTIATFVDSTITIEGA